MDITTWGATELALVIALAVIVVSVIAAWLYFRKRRTKKLRAQRVQSLKIRELAPGDRARFVDSWSRIQARFVDGPGGAVTEADQLLSDVMSTRGYPVSDFEQRAADISVDHPLVMENYRSAHEIAVRQTRGLANTEDLRQAMIQFRTLFEELVSQPELARADTIS